LLFKIARKSTAEEPSQAKNIVVIGGEIADYVGADEFFPFLLKADLGKRQWFRLAVQSADGQRRFHCIRIESFLM